MLRQERERIVGHATARRGTACDRGEARRQLAVRARVLGVDEREQRDLVPRGEPREERPPALARGRDAASGEVRDHPEESQAVH